MKKYFVVVYVDFVYKKPTFKNLEIQFPKIKTFEDIKDLQSKAWDNFKSQNSELDSITLISYKEI